jgi:hypothetical protein
VPQELNDQALYKIDPAQDSGFFNASARRFTRSRKGRVWTHGADRKMAWGASTSPVWEAPQGAKLLQLEASASE